MGGFVEKQLCSHHAVYIHRYLVFGQGSAFPNRESSNVATRQDGCHSRLSIPVAGPPRRLLEGDLMSAASHRVGSPRVWAARALRFAVTLAALAVFGFAATPALAKSKPKAAPASKASTSKVKTGLESIEQQVRTFTLPNGLRFIVVERHQAPVFSFMTVVDAGSANDQIGTTGLAHMMEHMAFKGTPLIGTSDYAKEKTLLAND